MSSSVRLYFLLLLAIAFGWLWLHASTIAEIHQNGQWFGLLWVTAIYLCAHLFRMLRLTLLTLDMRDKVFPLIAAHTLTAFPSSFLPFKLGEVLRLAAFFHVYNGRRKALAVWLAERFGDVVVISSFILSLYLFNISIPNSMRALFVIFIMVSVVGLLGLFAVTKICVYLNRHLVLTSHTSRGLILLRTSHALRCLELDIYKSVEGRLSGFVLLSMLIWTFEILALSLFIKLFSIGKPDFAALFVSGLLTNLSGGVGSGTNTFGLYQSFCLVVLSLVFLVVLSLTTRLKIARPN